MGAPSHRRAGVRGTPRISAVLGVILFTGACLAACTVTPESAAPTARHSQSRSFRSRRRAARTSRTVRTHRNRSAVPRSSLRWPRAAARERRHDTRSEEPEPGRFGFHTVEYTIPPGWETGDVYIGKNLGQPGEVAISFWTPSGVYSDPCRRTANLSPIDLAVHTHADGGELILMSYPQIGLSAQDGRAATEPRSLIVDDPSEDGGTIALRLELTVPADLDLPPATTASTWRGRAPVRAIARTTTMSRGRRTSSTRSMSTWGRSSSTRRSGPNPRRRTSKSSTPCSDRSSWTGTDPGDSPGVTAWRAACRWRGAMRCPLNDRLAGNPELVRYGPSRVIVEHVGVHDAADSADHALANMCEWNSLLLLAHWDGVGRRNHSPRRPELPPHGLLPQ